MPKKKTITNMTDALRCARKVATGQACTMQELKSTVTLLHQGLKTAQRVGREQKERVSFLERMMSLVR